jgi:hypothetical protein
MELRTENCEPFQPRPLRPRVVFKPCGVFFPPPALLTRMGPAGARRRPPGSAVELEIQMAELQNSALYFCCGRFAAEGDCGFAYKNSESMKNGGARPGIEPGSVAP